MEQPENFPDSKQSKSPEAKVFTSHPFRHMDSEAPRKSRTSNAELMGISERDIRAFGLRTPAPQQQDLLQKMGRQLALSFAGAIGAGLGQVLLKTILDTRQRE